MPRLNQVTLIGNLATEPSLYKTRTDQLKLSFRLAVPRPSTAPRKFSRANGNGNGRGNGHGHQGGQELADFVGVTMIGPQAAKTRAHLRAGTLVLIHGHLVSRDDAMLTEAMGRPFEVVEVLAHDVEFLAGANWERAAAVEEQQQYG